MNAILKYICLFMILIISVMGHQSNKSNTANIDSSSNASLQSPKTFILSSMENNEEERKEEQREEKEEEKKKKVRPIRRRDLLRWDDDEDDNEYNRSYDEFLQVPEVNKEQVALMKNDFEKAIVMDEDTFGYGYALIVFFVVLIITIIGYQALAGSKKTYECGQTLDECTDYLLFEGKDHNTEAGTVNC